LHRDNSYEWKNKKIAVIGNGSSGIQIVMAMQPEALKLVTYVRAPTWISTNFCTEKTESGRNFEYTEKQKEDFKNDPKAHFQLRKELEAS